MAGVVQNLRIHFYGTTGSGSTFPAVAERADWLRKLDVELLKNVFEDLQTHAGESGRLDKTVEEILGGPIGTATLLSYRNRLEVSTPRIYGGWSTCVRVETADGFDLVFDCGSGFRNCAKDLQQKWGERPERDLHIFGSHSHVDHTEGFDQAAVCFDKRNRIHIHGNRQFLYALDSYLGIFSKHVPEDVLGVHTPINYAIMPAQFEALEIGHCCEDRSTASWTPVEVERHELGDSIELGETRITPFEVFHPAPCLAYRVERRGKVFVFCTDHELRHGPDPDDPRQKASLEAEARVIEYSRGADVLYRDGQYLRSEYDGVAGIGSSNSIPRLDWGHSCVEDIQAMAIDCGVRRTYIGHHDPNRDWSEMNWIDETLAGSCSGRDEKIELACACTDIDI